jgi:chaperone modulatory protein CbpM
MDMKPRTSPPRPTLQSAQEGQLYLSRAELAAAAGITPATLARLIRVGLVEPAAPGASYFTATSASRLRRMWRLHVDLGVNLVGAAIVVDLLQRLERLERELARRSGGGP